MKWEPFLLLLFGLVACSWGFAIVDRGRAITATGTTISLSTYNENELLDPSQDWLFDGASGYIYLKYLPNQVLGITSNGSGVQIFNKTVLNSNTQEQVHWNLTLDGNTAQFRNTKLGYYLSRRPNSIFVSQRADSFTLFNPFLASDYIVVGVGAAGAKIAKRLTDDLITSVIAIDAGPRLDDDPAVCCRGGDVEGSAYYNFVYYSEKIANLGGQKFNAAVGKMWGGTTGHNSHIYDRGLRYDWQLMEAAGGSNWNYENHIQAQFHSQENYTGTVASGYFGISGEIDVIDSVFVPDNLTDVIVEGAKQIFPTYARGAGVNLNETGSSSTLQLTMQDIGGERYIRESSSTAHLYPTIITPEGNGVGGRKLRVIGEAIVDKLVFHPLFPKRAVGVQYIDKNGHDRIILADREIIISAGAYNSPVILMRSGIGNCSELSAFNITCRENNEYVGSNLQDHTRVQLQFSASNFTGDYLFANYVTATNTNWYLLEGRLKSDLAPAYTDTSITEEIQPDTKLVVAAFPIMPFYDITTLFNLNWLHGFRPPIFELNAWLLRPKCMGRVALSSVHPAIYPMIQADYLCDPDDRNWARHMMRNLSAMVEKMREIDPSYQVVFPPKSMIDDDVTLEQILGGLTNSYRHPAGTCRMAPRDETHRGVLDGELRVYGIPNVRVADASVFATIPSANPQAAIYAMAGRVVELIQNATQN